MDVFCLALHTGQQSGPSESPIAFQTSFGLVRAGPIGASKLQITMSVHVHHVTVNHSTVLTTDDLLCRFWEVKEIHYKPTPLSLEDKAVLTHF